MVRGLWQAHDPHLSGLAPRYRGFAWKAALASSLASFPIWKAKLTYCAWCSKAHFTNCKGSYSWPAIGRRNAIQKSVILLMAGYVLILIGVVAYARHSPLHGPLGYIAGVLPALPVIGVFFVLGRYLVEEQDEYLRVQVTRRHWSPPASR